MVLKVDLQCHKCYKKVKKVLCKFPQIRDQIYDEKQNQVVIKVVCCSPEKIRDKICCKGKGTIISIEIKEPEKPKPKETRKPKPVDKPADKPKEIEKPKPVDKPKETEKTEKPKAAPDNPKEGPPKPKQPPPPGQPQPMPVPVVPCYPPRVPVNTCCTECYHGHLGGPCYSGHGTPRVPVNTCCTECHEGRPEGPCYSRPNPVPIVPCYPPRVPVNTCCTECQEGRPGGPCYSGYGGGPAPYIQYDGYYGRPVYDSYSGGGSRGYNSSYCVTRPDSFSEENPQACTIM